MAGQNSKFANLSKRLSSGVLLAFFVLFVMWLGGFFFAGLMAIAASILLFEWMRLVKGKGIIWLIFGIFYITAGAASLAVLSIEGTKIGGLPMEVLYILIVIVATDTGAYFSGKTIGGVKLCPSISPGKTWAGLIGGVMLASFASLMMEPHVSFPAGSVSAIFTGIIMAVLGQIGDLFISWMKRRAGVKDSGKILPGHGGLFDRMDGIMLASPFYLLTFYFYGSVS